MTSPTFSSVTVIGAGLAGSECAFQLAERGVNVTLLEQKPADRPPAHVSNRFAELVCSNSLRSDDPQTAIGLLHEELRRVGSLILRTADTCRVPAGAALAVDREKFSATVEQSLRHHPRIEVVVAEARALPEGRVVVATGPLTSSALVKALEPWVGEKLYFYDAIAPIVSADSLDLSQMFRASRYGKGDGADYLNIPLSEELYRRFVAEVRAAPKVAVREFEEPKYFDGCLPIEVMAERGELVLAHGPMKPVGLTDPRTGKRPFAVVQLRQENAAATAYNLVGFQTRLTWREQKRIFGLLPGLENAEWLRLGQVHRNTYIEGPSLLQASYALRKNSQVYFAGQITGVEGYVESAASGFLTAHALACELRGVPYVAPPEVTALGALHRHIVGGPLVTDNGYQPSNVNYALFPPLEGRVKRPEKKAAYSARARAALGDWLHQQRLPTPLAGPFPAPSAIAVSGDYAHESRH